MAIVISLHMVVGQTSCCWFANDPIILLRHSATEAPEYHCTESVEATPLSNQNLRNLIGGQQQPTIFDHLRPRGTIPNITAMIYKATRRMGTTSTCQQSPFSDKLRVTNQMKGVCPSFWYSRYGRSGVCGQATGQKAREVILMTTLSRAVLRAQHNFRGLQRRARGLGTEL